jgi:hypothetical protein
LRRHYDKIMPEEIPPGGPATPLPPAAVIVVKSPRELQLEQQLEAAETARLEAERLAAENEDKFVQLRDIDTRRPAPGAPAQKPKRVPVKFPTLIHEAEESDETPTKT